MDIQEIKSRLALSQVLDHYGLKPDKNHRLHCPWHDDKTPSLQLYPKSDTWTCFSSNCSAGSGDAIEFCAKMEKDKHKGILVAKSLVNGINQNEPGQLSRIAVLTKLFGYFKNAVSGSNPAKDYLESRNLDFTKIEVGYNSGQFHHGTRKDHHLIESCLKYGLLLDKGHVNNRTGEKAYSPFGKNCIVFALRSRQNQVTGLYFRSTIDKQNSRHFYLKNREGLYPKYPSAETQKLILTESIIDAASLLQQLEIAKEYTVLSLYGTNGLTEEHTEAVSQLKDLQEVIFFLNGDAPGKEAVKKYASLFRDLLPEVRLSNAEPPENEDVNSLLQGHNPQILDYYIRERKPILFSSGISPIEKEKQQQPEIKPEPRASGTLNTKNSHHIIYKGQTANYIVKGLQKGQLDSLKITLFIEHPKTERKSRSKVDLYEDKQVERTAREAAEKLELRTDLIILDMEHLTDLLDQHREASNQEAKSNTQNQTPNTQHLKSHIDFLSKPSLIHRFNDLIGKAGVIGEENNRIFLFGIATSYKMPVTLHALIQGSSGSGKTHLLTAISKFIPEEDKKHFTRVTEGSLYNYGQYDLSNKLICLEDLDGMKEEAYLAFRELQSRGMISSSTSGKDEDGNIRAYEKVVYGPIASMSCTTKGEIYEDNMNRCFLIAVDEGKEQTARIITYQNQKSAGKIDKEQEQKITGFIKNCVRVLKPYEVVNPYADQVQLPREAQKIRRLNELYQSYVKQITLLNQYRRNKDQKGRLISEKEDLQVAAEIMFDSILLKIDELDGSLRMFYERLKEFVKSKGENYQNYSFGQREIRQALNVSKTQLHRYMHDLIGLEYIQQSGGYANRGYEYKISYWDNVQALRAKVKRHLQGQLDQLEMPVFQSNGTPNGTPEKEKKAV
jgi:DNA primase